MFLRNSLPRHLRQKDLTYLILFSNPPSLAIVDESYFATCNVGIVPVYFDVVYESYFATCNIGILPVYFDVRVDHTFSTPIAQESDREGRSEQTDRL